MQVVYLDTLFFLNLFADYYLLVLTARLCGVFRKRRFLFLGAAVGALAAVLLYFPKMPPAVSLLAQTGVCAAVVFAAFGVRNAGELLRLCGCFTLLSFFSAGAVLACSQWCGDRVWVRNGTVYCSLNATVTAAAFCIVYLFSVILFRKGRMRRERTVRKVAIRQNGRECTFQALYDSGNLLRDPLDGRPVLLISTEPAEQLFSEEQMGQIGLFYQKEDACVLSALRESSGIPFRLIPMHTAGGDRVILAFSPQMLEIDGNRRDDLLVGISPHPIAPDGDCKGLIGVTV